MSDSKDKTRISSPQEDSIDAEIDDKHAKEKFKVDGIKTGSSKRSSTQDIPADEQMYGSFDEIREAKGMKKDESKED
ncbi:MAG: hypothetical protein ABI390_05555 [Daejeonella sp.]